MEKQPQVEYADLTKEQGQEIDNDSDERYDWYLVQGELRRLDKRYRDDPNVQPDSDWLEVVY